MFLIDSTSSYEDEDGKSNQNPQRGVRMENDYIIKPPPKSTDIDEFGDALLDKIITDPEFSKLRTWNDFRGVLQEKMKPGRKDRTSKEIMVASWRKFYRIIKFIKITFHINQKNFFMFYKELSCRDLLNTGCESCNDQICFDFSVDSIFFIT